MTELNDQQLRSLKSDGVVPPRIVIRVRSRNMAGSNLVRDRRGPALVAFGVAAALTFLSASSSSGQDDAAALVKRLPTNAAVLPDPELEKRIAALGPAAIPALIEELQLGVRFKTLNKALTAGTSRRTAVVSVLAQIPGDESTDALVKALSDPPDCYGMTVAILTALQKRTLSNEQIVAMLKNHEPQIVMAGLGRATGKMAHPAMKAAVERLLDKEAVKIQFRNEYGASTAGPEPLWDVRLAAGKALGRDMLREIRQKAGEILAELKRESLRPTKPDVPAPMSYASQVEATLCRSLERLSAFGQPIRDLVEKEAKESEGNHAKLLDMALARLGDRARVAKIAEHVVSADSPTVRFCAAMTLRRLADRSAIPSLRKALRDTYQRQDGSCLRTGDGLIYPIRLVAADALVDLGEDPKEVRAEMGR